MASQPAMKQLRFSP